MQTSTYNPLARRTGNGVRLARAAAATALAGAALLWGASPALAHDELVGTAFEMNDTGSQVEAVVLSYSAVILDVGTEIIVTGPDGGDAAAGAPEQDGRDVRQALAEDLSEGTYDFVWRVVSSDGHPIEGAFSFEVAEGVEPTVLPFSEDTADDAAGEHDHGDDHDHESAEGAEAAGDGGADGDGADGIDADGSDTANNSGNDLPVGLTIGIIAAIVVAGAGMMVALSRRRRTANADPAGSAADAGTSANASDESWPNDAPDATDATDAKN